MSTAVAVPGQAQGKPAAKSAKKPFAMGTSLYPVPISGSGGSIAYSPNGRSTLTPIPKSGFLSRLRFTFDGEITFSTASSFFYTLPVYSLIQNYTLSNSLAYPYRSMSGADWVQMQRVWAQSGIADPTAGSISARIPDPTSTAANQKIHFVLEDLIGQNDGVNFARYLLSAMTTSNDLTVTFQWSSTAAPNFLQGGAVVSALTLNVSVSAEYLTVPDPSKYEWPKRNLVQQIVGDASYNNPRPGLNVINLTPIQGPEFTALGIQIVEDGFTETFDPSNTNVQEIDIYVNGTIPLMQFTIDDIITRYERMFGRQPVDGWCWLDFSNDLGLINAMSHLHRKVLSTAKYSQISVNVTLKSGFNPSNSYINLLKRTQQSYGGNS